jgi:hypothetical protein
MHVALALALLTAATARPPMQARALAIEAGATATRQGLAAVDTMNRQQQRPLAITFDPERGYRPVVHVGQVLADDELEEAATSGLPLRVRVRVELWKDRLFDQLVDTTSWSTVIVHEPIGEQFFVRSLPAARGSRRASSFESARQAVESEYPLDIMPRGSGQYYYTVSLQIETLSVSDLEELERWLQGELQPAVSGQRSVPGAVGQGAKRLLLRILDLPERRYDARTGRFRVP